MSSIAEAIAAATPYGAVNAAGNEVISFDQSIVFDLYIRLVLPLDGFVYWVRASTVSPSALLNAFQMNQVQLNQPGTISPAASFIAKGALHYESNSEQNVDANYTRNSVVFTALEPVQNFNSIGPDLLYIGRFDAPTPASSQPPADTTEIRFAFSGRGSYFQQMNLWHYHGNAVFSTMMSQVVEDPRTIDATKLILSNSMPFWLNFNQYNPAWPVPVPRPLVPMFPAMLVEDNRTAPYFSVDIDSTEGVQSAPRLTRNTDHYQQAKDTVRLVLYGADNNVAMDFIDSFLQYSYDTELFGIMNVPMFRDEKEGQNELNTLAKKKVASFEISYNQAAVRNVARQLILSCIPTVTGSDFIVNVDIIP